MRKFASFYATNAFSEKLAPQFFCGKEKMSYAKICSCARPVTENLQHIQRLIGSGFISFTSSVYGHFWCVGKRVFNIAFAVFVYEQISLSQKTCCRKSAHVD